MSFKEGDIVLYCRTNYIFKVKRLTSGPLALEHVKTKRIYAMPDESLLTLASPDEIKAGHRL